MVLESRLLILRYISCSLLCRIMKAVAHRRAGLLAGNVFSPKKNLSVFPTPNSPITSVRKHNEIGRLQWSPSSLMGPSTETGE